MPRWKRLGVLTALYVAQGLPYGFQTGALVLYLRAAHVSLTALGFANLLALPYLLKFLWAPLVERYFSPRIGRRKSWILPAQAALMIACGMGALIPPTRIAPLVSLVFVMTLIAATQDIAVDGLAVDLLAADELGLGNIAQVSGYKVGMLLGGGLLVWASQWIGWRGIFLGMAGVVAIAFVIVLLFDEPPAVHAGAGDRVTFDDVLVALGRALKSPESTWLIVFLLTYKLVEAVSTSMFKPFLVDAHAPIQKIALWEGTYGLIASTIGSALGGLVAQRAPLGSALWITAAGRVIPQGFQAWIAATGHVTAGVVISSTCVEHIFGGALTTVVFAFMMSRTDKKIGAAHYTLLACVEVAGKFPGGWISGLVAKHLGYTAALSTGTALSAAFLALLPFIVRTARTAPSIAAAS
jgi:predicted MFS family arabinose efflux permease